jgi:hypothetical protein
MNWSTHMHPKASKAIAESLARFVVEMDREERPTGTIVFPDAQWQMLDAGRLSFLFRRPETKQALAEFRQRFTDRAD